MISLQVALGERSYPIYIGSGLLADNALLTAAVPGEQVMVVTNETVGPLYLEPVVAALGETRCRTLVLPDGERFKTLAQLERVTGALLEAGFNRQCVLVALGGGVIGDIVGFAAACYQRGVRFVQIPTTLLAQVDSSVGGKTAVNHPLGKNMIGAFHQPIAVVSDIASLATLADREFRAGLAEVIKYGLIGDRALFDWLEANLDALLRRDDDALTYAIRRSCENKAEVVAADERESGRRALLNLGHTFGHAIETTAGYGEWLHGEAVAAGICMAADFSARCGWLREDERARVEALFARAGLPVAPPPEIASDQLEAAMRRDKKNRGDTIRLVAMHGLGESIITDDYPPAHLAAVLARARPAARDA